jgi:hypothetical protein
MRPGLPNQVEQERLALIAHPRAKTLRGQAVLVLTHKTLVELEREAQHIRSTEDTEPNRARPAAT